MRDFKVYIYRPDLARINPNLLFTLKGKPYFESREREKEVRGEIKDLEDALRRKKNITKREL